MLLKLWCCVFFFGFLRGVGVFGILVGEKEGSWLVVCESAFCLGLGVGVLVLDISSGDTSCF